MAASPGALKPVSKQDFTDWHYNCRVKQVQRQHEAILADARQNGRDLLSELKSRGYEDMAAFTRQCPRFPFFCWPSDFAELGGGYVLYFHFLIFCGLFLFLAFLVQLPAFIDYYDEELISLWDKGGGTIGHGYITPGNLGPDLGEGNKVPMCYFILACLMSVAIVTKSAFQVYMDERVDHATTQPNDFAVLVEGLPRTATDEADILAWFSQNAIRGRTDVEVVKVVIGWDAKEWRQKRHRLIFLTKALAGLDPASDEAQALMKERAQVNFELMSTAPDIAARLASSGVVVVIFRRQLDARLCVERFTSTWALWAYRDWGKCGGLLGGPQLPCFPLGGRPLLKLRVRRAPNPRDINWDDLGVPRSERYLMFAKTNLIMIICIGISFGMCYLMTWIKEQVDSGWLGALPVVGIAFANTCVTLLSKKYGEREYHNTIAGQTASQSLKMSVGMIVNTAGVLLVVNPRAWEWYKSTGLVPDLVMLLSLTCCIQPLFLWIDLKYYLKYFTVRRRLTQEQIDGWNDVKQKCAAGPMTKELQQQLNMTQQRIQYFMTAFQPTEMDMLRRYAYVVRTFVCCLCYSPLLPIAAPLGIGGIIIQYWVDKYLLLRWAPAPANPQSGDQARHCLLFLRVAALLYPAAAWMFLFPSWKENHICLFWMGLSYIPTVVVCILPLAFLRRVLCWPCRRHRSRRVACDDHHEDYYAVQHLWPKEMKYHKTHEVYKCLPEAKNPEILIPGQMLGLKADEVKRSYGTAVGAPAAAGGDPAKDGGGAPAAYGAAPAGAAGASPAVYGAAAPAPAPGAAVYGAGAPTAAPDAPAATPTVPATPGTVTVTVAPPMAPAAPAGAAVAAAHDADRKAVWEFEGRAGFSRYDHDCHDFIERKYQEFRSGGANRVRVKTKDVWLSIDFEKMTQMVEGKDRSKLREIRRREGAES